MSEFRAPYPIDTTASVQKAACYMYIDGTVQIGPRGSELLLMLVVVNQTTPDMYPRVEAAAAPVAAAAVAVAAA